LVNRWQFLPGVTPPDLPLNPRGGARLKFYPTEKAVAPTKDQYSSGKVLKFVFIRG